MDSRNEKLLKKNVMKKTSILILFSTFIFSCSSCKDRDTNSPYLEKDYVFIVGILVPDSVRTYKQEIFVGKILDKPVEEPPPEGKDTVVHRVLRTVHSWYQGHVIGSKDANVYIADQMGNRVKFHEIGDGIYRDIYDSLKVETSKTYFLEVILDDHAYTSQTIVPGAFEIINIANNDTISVTPELLPGTSVYNLKSKILWTKSESSYFYRIEIIRNTSGIVTLDHTFEINDSYSGFVIDTTKIPINTIAQIIVNLCSIDSNYARIYMPGDSYTGSNGFFDYIRSVEDLPLPKRSNINGSNDVVGVFGSYNSLSRIFFMKALQNKKNNKENVYVY